MSADEIDRILSRKEEIVPSSGFVASVMEAVRAEAATPAPIPFPWRRALPGMAAAGLACIAVIVLFIVQVTTTHRGSSVPVASPETSMAFDVAGRFGVGWITLAFLLAFVSVKLSMRLAGVRA